MNGCFVDNVRLEARQCESVLGVVVFMLDPNLVNSCSGICISLGVSGDRYSDAEVTFEPATGSCTRRIKVGCDAGPARSAELQFMSIHYSLRCTCLLNRMPELLMPHSNDRDCFRLQQLSSCSIQSVQSTSSLQRPAKGQNMRFCALSPSSRCSSSTTSHELLNIASKSRP